MVLSNNSGGDGGSSSGGDNDVSFVTKSMVFEMNFIILEVCYCYPECLQNVVSIKEYIFLQMQGL